MSGEVRTTVGLLRLTRLDRLPVADPEDVEAALINVKIAEERKDAALTAKWKERVAQVSARVLVTVTETQRGGTSG